MQCFGLACLASARNLIIFVLFYLLPHRQFLLLLLLLVLPLLLLVCLLLLLLRFPPPLCRFTACSPIPFLLFRPFFTVYFNGLAKVLLSLYIYNIYKDKCIYTRADFAHAVLATPTMSAHAIVNYLLTTYCVLSYCFSVAFCFEIINNGRCQVKGGFWD